MKRLIVLTVVLVGLIVTAIAGAPLIAATDFAKRRIASQIEEWTGHPVSFVGTPQVKLFPFLSLTIDDARIGTLMPTESEPFVTMQRLTCKLRILPFLMGRVEVAEFQFFRPHFRFLVGADGTGNWRLRGVSGPPENPARSETFAETRLGRINIADGTLTYSDARNGRREQFSGLDVSLLWPRAREAVSGSGAFTWRGEAVEFNVSLAQPLELMAGGTSPARFAVASRPARISFTGTMNSAGATRIAGPAAVTTPSLRRLLTWLGTPQGDGPTLGAGLIDGTLTVQGQTAAFADARFELDGNIGTGGLSIDVAGREPRLSGRIDFNRLDLTAYVEALQFGLNNPDASPTEPLGTPPFDIADADVELSAGQVLIGKARLGRSTARIGFVDRDIEVRLDEARLYGGRLTGEAHLRGSDDGLSGSVRLAIDKAKAGPILSEFAGLDALTGVLSGTLELSTAGETAEAWSAAARGKADFTIINGSMGGIELGELAALFGAPDAVPAGAEDGRIPFRSLTGSLDLAEQALVSDDLRLDGKGFALSLAGRLTIPNAAINGRGTLKIAEHGGDTAPQRSVPFVIGGSLIDPFLLPDYERLIEGSIDGHIAPRGGAVAESLPPKG